MNVLVDLKNHNVRDTFFLVCDGLNGLLNVVANVWPLTTVQTCIIHLIRSTFKLASKEDRHIFNRDAKPIYTTLNPTATGAALDGLTEEWGKKYGRSSGSGSPRGKSSSRPQTTIF